MRSDMEVFNSFPGMGMGMGMGCSRSRFPLLLPIFPIPHISLPSAAAGAGTSIQVGTGLGPYITLPGMESSPATTRTIPTPLVHYAQAAAGKDVESQPTAPAQPDPGAAPPAAKPRLINRVWFRWAVIGGVLTAAALLAVIIVFTTTDWGTAEPPPVGRTALHLEDVYNGRLSPRRATGQWHARSAHERLQFNAAGHLVLYDPQTNAERRLLDAGAVGLNTSYTQQLSADGQYVLLEQYGEQVFRHSRKSRYQLLVVNGTRPIASISATNAEDDAVLDYATFGPTGNQIAFVQRQNLYYIPAAHLPAEVVAITATDSAAVFNGICDWAYEEEIFSRTRALWFAPDGRRLAYAQFDDARVRTVTMWHMGKHTDGLAAQYPTAQHISYPKVGTVNPHVRLLWVALPETALTPTLVGASHELPVPRALQQGTDGEEPVLTAVDWTADERVLAVWMNRQQNRAHVQEYETETGAARQLFDVVSASGWLSIGEPLFLNRGRQQIALIADLDDHKHLVTYAFASPAGVNVSISVRRQLTSGAFNVQRIVHWNTEADALFVIGNNMSAPQDQHLYVVHNVNDSTTQTPLDGPQCLTCDLPGYSHFDAQFSASGQRLVLVSQGPAVPRYDAYEWTNGSLRWVRTLEDNAALHKKLETVALPLVRYMEVPLSGAGAEGLTARVRLQLPPGFDAAANRTYPLLVHVYAGPGTYAGTAAWSLGYSAFVATNRSVVVAQIDGRGTERQTVRKLHAVYERLGQHEIEDQVDVAGQLAKSLAYVDATRVAIWGWSYGGYATGMALASDAAHVFRCGASVAPVTDWTRYDTLYTERYMGLAGANAAGYRAGSLMQRATGLRNRTYLLVHGTGDDNVHFQHAMELARKLELEDIAFEQMAYTDEDHSLQHVLPYFYRRLTHFFDRCFE